MTAKPQDTPRLACGLKRLRINALYASEKILSSYNERLAMGQRIGDQSFPERRMLKLRIIVRICELD